MSNTSRNNEVMKYCFGDDAEFVAVKHYDRLQRELAEVTKQRDAAIEGLEKIASLDFVITLPDRMDAVREIANETLNKLKP